MLHSRHRRRRSGRGRRSSISRGLGLSGDTDGVDLAGELQVVPDLVGLRFWCGLVQYVGVVVCGEGVCGTGPCARVWLLVKKGPPSVYG